MKKRLLRRKHQLMTSTCSLSGQTAKRETRSTNKQQVKKKSGLFGAGATKKQRNLRKDRCLAFKEDTCDNGEVAEALPVTLSGGRDVMTAAETHKKKKKKSMTAVLESQRKHRKAIMERAELTEETTGEQSNAEQVQCLQESTGSQASSRGKLRKQKTISPAAKCVRRTAGTTLSERLAPTKRGVPKTGITDGVSAPPLVSSVKAEAAWEPVTPTLTKRRKTRRQRQKPAEKQEPDSEAVSHDNVTSSQTKNDQMKNKAGQDETTDAGKEMRQMCRKLNGSISQVKEDDDMKMSKGKKKRLGGRRRPKAEDRGITAAPLLHDVSADDVVPNPPVSPVNENLQQEASQRRHEQVKSEPPPVSSRRGRMKTGKASRTKQDQDSGNEPVLETFNVVDLNTVKEEQSEINIQEIKSEGRALPQDKIRLERKRSRTRKLGNWTEPAAPETLGDQSSPPGGDQAAEAGEPEVTHLRSPSAANHPSPSANGDSDVRVSPGRTSRLRPPSFIRTHCGKYSCGRCLKPFSRWNKLWLHQRVHARTSGPFSCAHCELDFRFLASYVDHLRERASHSPYACALCGETFTDTETLSVHFSECHKQQGHNKCDTCGKIFRNLINLKKHKLLHKRVNSHFCLACELTFSSNGALKSHLKTHRPRLSVPQPAGRVGPLLFPYHCERCDAKFTSADLLRAHQVFHFTPGKQPETSPEETRGVASEASPPRRRLPVSNKKHLFRYPHPDRLYVVPALSAEPPVVISDTEEETSQTDPHLPQNQLEDSHQDLDCSARDADWSGAEPQDDALRCALCTAAFTDVSKLHQHYMDHARGV